MNAIKKCLVLNLTCILWTVFLEAELCRLVADWISSYTMIHNIISVFYLQRERQSDAQVRAAGLIQSFSPFIPRQRDSWSILSWNTSLQKKILHLKQNKHLHISATLVEERLVLSPKMTWITLNTHTAKHTLLFNQGCVPESKVNLSSHKPWTLLTLAEHLWRVNSADLLLVTKLTCAWAEYMKTFAVSRITYLYDTLKVDTFVHQTTFRASLLNSLSLAPPPCF